MFLDVEAMEFMGVTTTIPPAEHFRTRIPTLNSVRDSDSVTFVAGRRADSEPDIDSTLNIKTFFSHCRHHLSTSDKPSRGSRLVLEPRLGSFSPTRPRPSEPQCFFSSWHRPSSIQIWRQVGQLQSKTSTGLPRTSLPAYLSSPGHRSQHTHSSFALSQRWDIVFHKQS